MTIGQAQPDTLKWLRALSVLDFPENLFFAAGLIIAVAGNSPRVSMHNANTVLGSCLILFAVSVHFALQIRPRNPGYPYERQWASPHVFLWLVLFVGLFLLSTAWFIHLHAGVEFFNWLGHPLR